ncbi:hypothetical protein ACFSC4_20295 [Deinococcus malanensis]|uniref:hypothetical protein n=1 Tax=Deinococcus malanensis TaxID=1706855 RepID=UPI0036332D76
MHWAAWTRFLKVPVLVMNCSAPCLRNSVGRSPTVVVFEDVHWADEATIDLLRFLGRRMGASRGS